MDDDTTPPVWSRGMPEPPKVQHDKIAHRAGTPLRPSEVELLGMYLRLCSGIIEREPTTSNKTLAQIVHDIPLILEDGTWPDPMPEWLP